MQNDSVICPKQVAKMLSISVTTLWRLRRAGVFPPAIKLSAHRIGWRESEIQAYLDRRLEPC